MSGLAYASQGTAVESGPFLSIMALLVVVMVPFLVLSMIAVHAYASPSNKPYSLAALAFMIACMVITSCINFLLLLVSSQPNLFSESWRALFLPCKWPAPAFVLDNFVWDWFFGISMLLATPVFGGSTLKVTLRLVMILSGTPMSRGIGLACGLACAGHRCRYPRLGGGWPHRFRPFREYIWTCSDRDQGVSRAITRSLT